MLERALASITASLRVHPRAVELLVVDNRSDSVDSRAWLEALPDSRLAQAFVDVRVLRHDSVFNYSSINNAAAREARGDMLCFLNNDIEVIAEDWLCLLHEQAEQPDKGCIGAMLFYPDDTIQHAGVILGMEKVAGHAYKHWPRSSCVDHPYFDKPQAVSAVTAACLMIRRAVFEEVGGFDENLAVAYNDVDLCLAVQQAGYQNVWTPQAELYHHESVSRGRRNPGRQRRLQHREEIRYMRSKWGSLLRRDPHWHVDRHHWLPGRERRFSHIDLLP